MPARVLLLPLAATCLLTAEAVAQNTRHGVGFRLVPGLGVGFASFGDDDPETGSGGALTLGGMVLLPLSRSTDLVVEGTWRPTSIDNPHSNESYSSFYLMGGLELGSGVYVRPSLGVDLQNFSGQFAADDGAGLAIGFAVGTEKPIAAGPWNMVPEGSLRLSVSYGLACFLLLFSFGIGWRA
jgi:hypothetical protein